MTLSKNSKTTIKITPKITPNKNLIRPLKAYLAFLQWPIQNSNTPLADLFTKGYCETNFVRK